MTILGFPTLLIVVGILRVPSLMKKVTKYSHPQYAAQIDKSNCMCYSNSMFSDSVVFLLPLTKEELVRNKKKSRLDAAIQRYQVGDVTLGRASELAGLHRFEFEAVLKARGILKIVEVGSVEELKEGVSLIKSFMGTMGRERNS